jgi:hypothetical protein
MDLKLELEVIPSQTLSPPKTPTHAAVSQAVP